MRIGMVVGSRHGATREIGAVLAEELAAAGHEVLDVDPEEFLGPVGLDALVIGSAIYAGRFVPAVSEVLERHLGALREMPVWVFWSGPIGHGSGASGQAQDVRRQLERLRPRGTREFGGRLERAELVLRERAAVEQVGAEYGDFRDFEAVRAWAAEILEDLRGS